MAKARELLALLEDEPTLFAELAREHSWIWTANSGVTWARCCGGTAQRGGSQDLQRCGRGTAGSLSASDDELIFEIFRSRPKHTARLGKPPPGGRRQMICNDWLARAQEHRLKSSNRPSLAAMEIVGEFRNSARNPGWHPNCWLPSAATTWNTWRAS